MSEPERDTPHVPAPSLWPIGFAIGIACILVGLVVYGIFGLISDSAVRLIERRVLSWRRTLSS